MNTKQINYCIELAHTLNFSRAAENLFVSQPSFSYQIRLLEEEVGFDIFERSGKGASLTPAGTQFVGFLSASFAQGKQVQSVFELQGRYRRIGPSVPLAHDIPEFRALFTHLGIQIVAIGNFATLFAVYMIRIGIL